MNKELGLYWQTIVETMQDGLVVVDPSGIIVSTNPAVEDLTGYQAEELLGRPCSILGCDMCEQVKKDASRNAHCALFRDGRVHRARCTLRRKDGGRVHVLKNAALLKDHFGRLVGGVETLTDLTEVVRRDKVIDGIRRNLGMEEAFQGMVGRSPAMLRLFDLIVSAAESQAPVLIEGESGTGKELVAGAIHNLGSRAKGPFVKVNCAALNPSLLESELFGHVRGSFTGADRDRVGRFAAAHGGDFFLDEVGDLPETTQVKLLRVLQERVVERVGDHRPIPVDIRFVAAANRDLAGLVREGSFRQDLYYRVAVVPVRVPPLRDRLEDIPLLVEAFTRRIAGLASRPVPEVSPSFMDRLAEYPWPGNVRELINVVERAMVMSRGGRLAPRHLPPHLLGESEPPLGRPEQAAPAGDPERALVLEALEKAGGRRARAAEILGISRVTLWKRLKKLGIQVNRFGA